MELNELKETIQDFKSFIASEVKKYKGIYVPVRSGFLRRALVKNLPCRKLHPNPDDEFTFPDIGPNDQIIGQYVSKIQKAQLYGMRIFDEPLTVERIRPDGYMLLNGHHRWAAAIRMNLKKVPVEIVNLTQLSDIREMLGKSQNTKRATLDLDEVVFRPERDELTEKSPVIFLRHLYRENLRLGIPALFRYLNTHGYDVWVYSSEYHSLDHIRHLFLVYHVNVTGIVTGTGRKGHRRMESKEMDRLIAEKYPVTLHIDEKAVVRFENNGFEEIPLAAEGAQWSSGVIETIGKLEK